MKTHQVLAAFIAGFSGWATMVTPASAAPDVQGQANSSVSRPCVVRVADRSNEHSEAGVLQGPPREEPRMGVYGPDWYARQRQLQHRTDPHLPSAPQGHWKEIVVKDVIPAHWEVVGYDSQGRPIQNYQSEHVEFRTERVWVNDRG